jgi:hypothetical protein
VGRSNLPREVAATESASEIVTEDQVREYIEDLGEPTPQAMAAIEAEWPLIEAELLVLDAEIALINAADHGGPSPLDWRRLRRAEARVTRVAAELAARPARSNAKPVRRTPRVDAMPSATELAAIEAEWPLIAAELGPRRGVRREVA